MRSRSLSVPQKDIIDCTQLSHPGSTDSEKLWAAWHIFTGAGLSVANVTSCGDYMFSGHTATIMLFHLFLLEYTPDRTAKPLHIFSYVATMFGIFFVLASHQHYSIDTLMAVVISHRLFVHYHLSALSLDDAMYQKYIGLAFPFFGWFEEDVKGTLSHAYELPWRAKVFRQ